MADIVAKIQLAYGERSYFDELSDTYLNTEHPVKNIYKGTNCTNLRRAVKARHINLIAGSLGTPKTFKEIVMTAKANRTGEDLQTLMGNTPLHKEPEDVIGTDDVLLQSLSDTGENPTGLPNDNPPLMMSSMFVEPEPENDPQNNVIEPEVPETPEEPTEEPKEALSAKPASIRTLKIGASRDIEFNYNVTAVLSGNEEIATAVIKSNIMKVSVTGITAGETEILVSTENGDITIPITVVEA